MLYDRIIRVNNGDGTDQGGLEPSFIARIQNETLKFGQK